MLQGLFPDARVLVGAAANEATLRGLHAPTVLHAATHVVFAEDPKVFLTPAAAQGQRGAQLGRPRSPVDARALPPESAAALVLALPPAGTATLDDGLVTAWEIMGMDLRGTRLVVLSGCSSGRGQARTGQGVYGLRRAFFISGVETLVTSLWPVSDAQTPRLMADYYGGLKRGEGRAEALDRAMRHIRAQKPHPFYWAPFLVIGRKLLPSRLQTVISMCDGRTIA